MITFWGPRLVILIRMAIIIRGVVCLGKSFILIAIVGTSSNAHQPNHDDDAQVPCAHELERTLEIFSKIGNLNR